MSLNIDLTEHYEARRSNKTWVVYDKSTREPASGVVHESMPGAVTEANGLELLRES